jgi:uncharacterized protein (UPF0548 family)
VDDLTYPEHGATRAVLPSGYHHLERRARLGTGRVVFERGAAALMSWEMHRAAGLRVTAEGDARPGERVVSRIAPGIAAPCRVVYVIDEPGRRGFAYGTLPGHPESGEEAFIMGIDEADEVWFTVRAFTRPSTLLARISGPFGRGAQRLMAGRYIRAMRRLSARLGVCAVTSCRLLLRLPASAPARVDQPGHPARRGKGSGHVTGLLSSLEFLLGNRSDHS